MNSDSVRAAVAAERTDRRTTSRSDSRPVLSCRATSTRDSSGVPAPIGAVRSANLGFSR